MTEPDYGSAELDDFYVVNDPAQAEILSDSKALRFFGPFLARERSAGSAAAELGVPIDRLLYRIRRFLETGLLRIVREEPRSGRPIKIYRSSADAYFVPFAVTPFADVGERLWQETGGFLRGSNDAVAKHLVKHGADGRRLFRTDDGGVRQDAADSSLQQFRLVDAATPPVEAFMATLRLREADARELRSAMEALRERALEMQVAEGEGGIYNTVLLLVPTVAD